MTNLELFNKAFREAFGITEQELTGMEYRTKGWDSVGHMGLIAALEDAFGIILDIDDIMDLSSYQMGKEIVAKYGVSLE